LFKNSDIRRLAPRFFSVRKPIVLHYSPHIEQCTTINSLKAGKNEQNTDVT